MNASTIRARYRIGSPFKLSSDAVENYGAKYADKIFTVSAVSTAHMPAEEFYRRGRPSGYHPGFDASSGSALYDSEDLHFSVYDWEMVRA